MLFIRYRIISPQDPTLKFSLLTLLSVTRYTHDPMPINSVVNGNDLCTVTAAKFIDFCSQFTRALWRRLVQPAEIRTSCVIQIYCCTVARSNLALLRWLRGKNRIAATPSRLN